MFATSLLAGAHACEPPGGRTVHALPIGPPRSLSIPTLPMEMESADGERRRPPSAPGRRVAQRGAMPTRRSDGGVRSPFALPDCGSRRLAPQGSEPRLPPGPRAAVATPASNAPTTPPEARDEAEPTRRLPPARLWPRRTVSPWDGIHERKGLSKIRSSFHKDLYVRCDGIRIARAFHRSSTQRLTEAAGRMRTLAHVERK
jgi:hypothetical protein